MRAANRIHIRPQPRIAPGYLPPITIDRKNGTPVYRQLYDWFRAAILDGTLRSGQRVPSTRRLAAALFVSRIPVLSAYEQLLAEGYFEAFPGAGTCVSRDVPDDAVNIQNVPLQTTPIETRPGASSRLFSERSLALLKSPARPWLTNLDAFRVSLPALDHFPVHVWSKLLTRHSKMLSPSTMAYGDSMGQLPLRQAIAEYLGVMRGVQCTPSQILITTGSQQGLQISAQVLLNPGDSVCIEEPGYPGARATFAIAGAKLIPIAIDHDGIRVDDLNRRGRGARAVYVTPSHQFPMGVTMSSSRRNQLLEWADRTGGWIVEDDYDSEFQFDRRPRVSLQGLDRTNRVIYVGTFSKVMFPALRLGYVVVPDDLVAAFSSTRDAADIFSSSLDQLALTDFIREGHFARHIRRMRMLYMDRRQALVSALGVHIGSVLEVVGAEAGMHLVTVLPAGTNDRLLAFDAAKRGISAMPLSSCYVGSPTMSGLILGYGGISPRRIYGGVRQLKQSIESQLR